MESLFTEPISEHAHRSADCVSRADGCEAAQLLCPLASHRTFHRAGRWGEGVAAICYWERNSTQVYKVSSLFCKINNNRQSGNLSEWILMIMKGLLKKREAGVLTEKKMFSVRTQCTCTIYLFILTLLHIYQLIKLMCSLRHTGTRPRGFEETRSEDSLDIVMSLNDCHTLLYYHVSRSDNKHTLYLYIYFTLFICNMSIAHICQWLMAVNIFSCTELWHSWQKKKMQHFTNIQTFPMSLIVLLRLAMSSLKSSSRLSEWQLDTHYTQRYLDPPDSVVIKQPHWSFTSSTPFNLRPGKHCVNSPSPTCPPCFHAAVSQLSPPSSQTAHSSASSVELKSPPHGRAEVRRGGGSEWRKCGDRFGKCWGRGVKREMEDGRKSFNNSQTQSVATHTHAGRWKPDMS